MKTKLLTTALCLVAAVTASAVYSDDNSSKADSCMIFPKVDANVEQPAASGGGESGGKESGGGEESYAGKYFQLIRSLAGASDEVAVEEKYSSCTTSCFEKSAADSGSNAKNAGAGAGTSGTPSSYPNEMRMLLLLQAAILIPAILVGMLKIAA
jgi:hypothetical protein